MPPRRRPIYHRRRRRSLAPLLLAAGLIAIPALIALGAWGGNSAPDVAPVAPPRQQPPRVRPKRPPQFVVISFDGAGDADLWRYWRRVGRRTGARFTFFLSGVYLLDEAHRTTYLPPRHGDGVSDIGFMQADDEAPARTHVRDLLHQLALGHRERHEIGTHFNGHFCAPYDGSVGTWSARDWTQEIAQFDELLTRASALNAIARPVELGFGPADVIGARTPCLEGNLDVLYRVLRRHGFRYDSSTSALLGTWPSRVHGVWRFPLAEITHTGTKETVIAMDYNLLVNDPKEPSARQLRDIENQTLESFLNAFNSSRAGNRAPLSIGFHFARWNHGAYVRALTRFVERVCNERDVRCVPYRDVVAWLDENR